MKLPFGIAPGVGITVGGRRLAVRLLQRGWGCDGDDAAGAGGLVASAASATCSGRSEVDPHPAIAAATAEAASS